MWRIPLTLAIVLLTCRAANADLLPPGHKDVKHRLVFVETQALTNLRVVAAPTRGLRGSMEIVAGQPFHFSTKYGTRLYIVPDQVDALPEFEPDEYDMWTSLDIPVTEIRSVPWISPIASAITTLQLSETEDGFAVTVVNHEEFDGSNQPVNLLKAYLPLTIPLLIGIGVCFYLIRRPRGNTAARTGTQSSLPE